jgi:8-oxo-dGTP pyrophosphatase MutT (NUDIX family)
MTELPGGGVEAGESLAGGAARELAEETGYVSEELIYLGEMCYDGYFGGSRHYFLATGCERRQEQQLDAGEFVTVGDPLRLARFWAGVLGQEMAEALQDGIVLLPGDDTGFRLRFLPAQQQKAGQNHWH